MESRMDEMCAEVRNTASNIAELLAFMKRGLETPQCAPANVKVCTLNLSEIAFGDDVHHKTQVPRMASQYYVAVYVISCRHT